MLALVRAARLPMPDVNVRVGPIEVDFLWREERLVVEVDGFRFHSSRAAFERDRLRDAELQAGGLRVMRVTWRQLTREREATLARIARALVARPVSVAFQPRPERLGGLDGGADGVDAIGRASGPM